MAGYAQSRCGARSGAVLLALDAVYLELVLRLTTDQALFARGSAGGICTALALAMLFAALCSLFKGERAAWRASVVCAALMTVWFLFCALTYDAYKVFMPPDIILSQAGNAARDFGGNVRSTVLKSLPLILLYFLPVIAALPMPRILRRGAHSAARARGRLTLRLALSALALAAAGYLLSNCTVALRAQYASCTYDTAIKEYGAIAALVRPSAGASGTDSFSAVSVSPTPAGEEIDAADDPTASPVAEEEHEEYGLNIMDIDFAAHETSNAKLASLNEYIQRVEPTRKNEYTGLFAGKNLILITAEAFSKEVIDPERTPMLYRLATRGIVFEDFYQPAWGGSTSTGEYSFLTGLAPIDPMVMMASRSANMYFTMGNQLRRLGYSSFAYHDGSRTYYSRDLTLPNMGYDSFVGIGNGMEKGLTGGLFPESDKEMMDYTVPIYIESQPFSVYYMTISGHASYAFKSDINDMSVKNQSVTEGLDYSEPVRAYLAANQELEYALESLVGQLEDAGIADDTVIALVPDHYPYGLLPSNAWGGQTGLLEELYGAEATTCRGRDHNAAIIWSACLEDDAPITVSKPVSSIDILPTLSNLFGVEYDSRLLAGRDVFSGEEGLVFWNDGCWLTEHGYYDTHQRAFTPTEGAEAADEEYITRVSATVADRLSLSRIIENEDYYGFLFN